MIVFNIWYIFSLFDSNFTCCCGLSAPCELGSCRISQAHFPAECHKEALSLFVFCMISRADLVSCIELCIFPVLIIFDTASHLIGCQDCL